MPARPRWRRCTRSRSTTSGDWTAGESSAQRAIARFGDGWWSDPAGRFAWNVAARGVALSERWADDDPFVRDATMAMRRDPRRGISLEGVRALGHAFAGRPVDALRIAAGIRHAAPTMSILRVELALAEALARLEIGDRARARAELRAIADHPAEPRLYAPVASLLALADAAVDDGDLDAAADELGAAEALIGSSHGGPDLVEWARRTGANVALAAHDVELARLRVDALTDPFWAPVGRARLGLATGDRDHAVAELALAEPRCPRHHVVLGLYRARAATVPEEVTAALIPAVEIASAHDMLQTVVGHGRDLMDVIERAALARARRVAAPTPSWPWPPPGSRRSWRATSSRSCSPTASGTSCASSPAASPSARSPRSSTCPSTP